MRSRWTVALVLTLAQCPGPAEFNEVVEGEASTRMEMDLVMADAVEVDRGDGDVVASKVVAVDLKQKTESTTKKTEHFQPLPGYCATKSSEVVDYDQEWNNGCQDIKGNLYAQDQFLISCCGCFKIICNSTQPSVYSRHIVDKVFFWNKTVEAQCCQDCHGKVFAGGSIMNTEVLDDKCSTTVTTRCVFIGVDGEWKLIFRQTMPFLYKRDQFNLNIGDNGQENFAILGDFEAFKRGGKFQLKLKWPELGTENIWTQTSNPFNNPKGGVTGYQSISTPYTGCWYWGGLEYNNYYALLDGSINDGSTWWYAVGKITKNYHGRIPGPCGLLVKKVELYAYVNNKGQENRAIAEMFYNHRNCCSDENGLHTTGSTIDVPKTCSKRTCHREDGQLFSSWISNQVESGCNCCQLPSICSEPKVTCSAVEGTLMEDGGVLRVDLGYPNQPINLKCCQGKFVEDFKSG